MMYFYSEPIAHHGIQGQKWGIRRYQNTDGTLTEEGKKRYGDDGSGEKKKMSTGKKVAIGVGIAAGAAAVAGATALIATGKYKEIPDLINRGKEKVQMALIKAGKGELVYGKKEWEKQRTFAESLKNNAYGMLAAPASDGHLRRIQNNPVETFRRNKRLLDKVDISIGRSGLSDAGFKFGLTHPHFGKSILAETSDQTKSTQRTLLRNKLIGKEIFDSIKKTTL